MQKTQSTAASQQLVTSNATPQQIPSSAISVAPKFLFGFKGDVKNNLFFLDHNMVCYPCGHNIVFYKIDDQS
jgi:hypothetical protein